MKALVVIPLIFLEFGFELILHLNFQIRFSKVTSSNKIAFFYDDAFEEGEAILLKTLQTFKHGGGSMLIWGAF